MNFPQAKGILSKERLAGIYARMENRLQAKGILSKERARAEEEE